MTSAPSGFWTPLPNSRFPSGSQNPSPSRSGVRTRKTISASSLWLTHPRVRCLRKSSQARLGAKPATPITMFVEATILVTRQDRSIAASLTAKAGRNLVSGRKRNTGTSLATLANCSGQALLLRKPPPERRQERTVATDLRRSGAASAKLGRVPKRVKSLRMRKLIFGDDPLDILGFALDTVSKTSICLDGHKLNDGIHHRWIRRRTSLWTLGLVANVFIQLIGVRHVSISKN